jgi:hypothetical protein
MSTDIRARHGGQDRQPAPTRAQQKARALGLTSATGLVVGSIVGTGVFALERQPRSWTLTPNGDDYTASVARNQDLWDTVAEVLGVDKVKED